jgi:hypothetical protein
VFHARHLDIHCVPADDAVVELPRGREVMSSYQTKRPFTFDMFAFASSQADTFARTTGGSGIVATIVPPLSRVAGVMEM